MDQKYDYIVLGAGSAGCVLANRLSADKNNRVLLVEAGPKDNTMFIKIPMGFGVLVGSEKYAWHYRTKTFGKANIYEEWARGKTLGGSSAIN
ncbi:lycopene cyclase family protein, partial [Chryseobacterium luteum]